MSQVLWTFSIYLEAVAILPQLVCECHVLAHSMSHGPVVAARLSAPPLRVCVVLQVMLQNCGNVDNLTGNYVFFLGCAHSADARGFLTGGMS